MKEEIRKIYRHLKRSNIKFEKADFKGLFYDDCNLDLKTNDEGLLALIYLLTESYLENTDEISLADTHHWIHEKFIIDVQPFDQEYLQKKAEEEEKESKFLGYFFGFGCLFFAIFTIVSFFYGAFELISKIF